MSYELSILLAAAFGASLQELVHWYELRDRIELSTLRLGLALPYIAVTVAMILGCGVGTMIWLTQEGSHYLPRDAMIFGAAFPLIFKKLVHAAATQKNVTLGPPAAATARPSALSQYFS